MLKKPLTGSQFYFLVVFALREQRMRLLETHHNDSTVPGYFRDTLNDLEEAIHIAESMEMEARRRQHTPLFTPPKDQRPSSK